MDILLEQEMGMIGGVQDDVSACGTDCTGGGGSLFRSDVPHCEIPIFRSVPNIATRGHYILEVPDWDPDVCGWRLSPQLLKLSKMWTPLGLNSEV